MGQTFCFQKERLERVRVAIKMLDTVLSKLSLKFSKAQRLTRIMDELNSFGSEIFNKMVEQSTEKGGE